MSVKKVCDKCGETLIDNWLNNMFATRTHISIIRPLCSRDYDLCANCTNALVDFLNKPPDNETRSETLDETSE